MNLNEMNSLKSFSVVKYQNSTFVEAYRVKFKARSKFAIPPLKQTCICETHNKVQKAILAQMSRSSL